MDTTNEKTIQAIGAAAVVAGAQGAAMDEAFDAERTAEAEVLALAIAAARPGLRAISGRIKAGSASWSTQNGTIFHESKTWHAEKGVKLHGKGPEEDCPRDNDGSYEGEDHYLLDDGRLAVVVFSGSWSRWQCSPSEWTSTLTVITPREAMDRWDLAETLAAISGRLDKAVAGKAPEKTKAALARAEKLRAIVALAGGAS